jgi:hypothetical protein
VLALPSFGLGLAAGHWWAVALPLLIAAPYALAGDDGTNAFAYRLPTPAIGVLALAAAVLVLTAVLIQTGRHALPAWVGAALLLAGTVPLAWTAYRHLRPLDDAGDLLIGDEAGRFRNVSLGDSRTRVTEELGAALRVDGGTIAPVGEDFDDIGGPPFIATPGTTHESLRYRDLTVLLSNGRVYGLLVTNPQADTTQGVGIGDNLALAEERYSSLDCGIVEVDDYRRFPYCGGRIGRGRWIWFGQDPIRSIVVASSEIGLD